MTGLRAAVRSAWAGLGAGFLHTLSGPDHLAVHLSLPDLLCTMMTSRDAMLMLLPLPFLPLDSWSFPVRRELHQLWGCGHKPEVSLSLWPEVQTVLRAAGSHATDHWQEQHQSHPDGRALGIWAQHRAAHPGPADGPPKGIVGFSSTHGRT